MHEPEQQPKSESVTPAPAAGKARDRLDYSVWEEWLKNPDDPASRAEAAEAAAAEERAKDAAFEAANPDFVAGFRADMQKRKDAQLAKQKDADMLKARGNAAFKDGNTQRARTLWLEALSLSPYYIPILLNLAAAAVQTEAWDDAAEWCDRALHLDNCCVKAKFRRAAVHQHYRRYDLAAQDLEDALVVQPESAPIARQLRTVRALETEQGESVRPKAFTQSEVAPAALSSSGIADISTVGQELLRAAQATDAVQLAAAASQALVAIAATIASPGCDQTALASPVLPPAAHALAGLLVYGTCSSASANSLASISSSLGSCAECIASTVPGGQTAAGSAAASERARTAQAAARTARSAGVLPAVLALMTAWSEHPLAHAEAGAALLAVLAAMQQQALLVAQVVESGVAQRVAQIAQALAQHVHDAASADLPAPRSPAAVAGVHEAVRAGAALSPACDALAAAIQWLAVVVRDSDTAFLTAVLRLPGILSRSVPLALQASERVLALCPPGPALQVIAALSKGNDGTSIARVVRQAESAAASAAAVIGSAAQLSSYVLLARSQSTLPAGVTQLWARVAADTAEHCVQAFGAALAALLSRGVAAPHECTQPAVSSVLAALANAAHHPAARAAFVTEIAAPAERRNPASALHGTADFVSSLASILSSHPRTTVRVLWAVAGSPTSSADLDTGAWQGLQTQALAVLMNACVGTADVMSAVVSCGAIGPLLSRVANSELPHMLRARCAQLLARCATHSTTLQLCSSASGMQRVVALLNQAAAAAGTTACLQPGVLFEQASPDAASAELAAAAHAVIVDSCARLSAAAMATGSPCAIQAWVQGQGLLASIQVMTAVLSTARQAPIDTAAPISNESAGQALQARAVGLGNFAQCISQVAAAGNEIPGLLVPLEASMTGPTAGMQALLAMAMVVPGGPRRNAAVALAKCASASEQLRTALRNSGGFAVLASLSKETL